MPLTKFRLPGLRIVGMHHYGAASLALEVPYVAVREPSNKSDAKAVAIKNGPATRGYLKREDAHRLAFVMDSGLVHDGRVYIKCHHMSSVKTQKFGPEQLCNLGFRCIDTDSEKLKQLLDSVALNYDVLS